MWWAELLNSIVSVLDSGGAGGGGGAYESIATATGTGSSGTITFSSIPSIYQHLQIRGNARSDVTTGGGRDIWFRFNGDTTTAYDSHYLYGNGSAASAGAITTTSRIYANTSAGALSTAVMGGLIFDLHDYASTTKNKTARIFHGLDGNTASTDYTVYLSSGLWRNTAAVNSITIICVGANFTTDTVFSLYGIKGA
jgi:hypothetical protein